MIAVLTRSEVRGRLNSARLKRRITRLLKTLNISTYELSILLTNDDEIRELNREYRGRMARRMFYHFHRWMMVTVRWETDSPHLGDIVISVERADVQALRGCLPRLSNVVAAIPPRKRRQSTWSLEDEVIFLCLHGVLHLIGHDHIEEVEAVRMEALEIRFYLPICLPLGRQKSKRVSTG